MKKRNSLIFTILLIILSLLLATFSQAFTFGNQDSNTNIFAKFDLEELLPGGINNLTIDLSEIDYDDFQILIVSDVYVGLPTVNEEIEDYLASDFDIDSNELKIIGNKTDLNLSELVLIYTIPNYISSGTVANFEVYLMEYLDGEGEIDETTILQNSISLKIVDDNQNNNEENKSDVSNNENNTFTNPLTSEKTESGSSTNQYSSSGTKSSNGSSILSGSNSNVESVTYNGSSNNYLSELSISNYDLTFNFAKEHSSYFINVDNSVESIDISAIAENSSSVVCIYGNDNLSIGTNKILISVTSESGNVRNYRIYVNRAE